MLVDNNHGTKLFLQKLASNPLVRKSLPNAAAICQQYFAFRRNPQESIGNFLVRETLVHEEFCEAIIRLYEEKQGISQDQRDFGLPEPDEWDDQSWTDDSWAWWPWEEGDEADEGENDAAAPTATTPTGEGSPGMEPRGSTSPGARQGATGSSPSHAGNASAVPVGEEQPPPAETKEESKSPQAIDELTIADSFIMGVLRGWRLLQASGLSPDEMRDILSATKNSLDYDMIAAALQNLWDDQLLNSRNRHKTSYHMNYANEADESELYLHEYENGWDPGESDWWSDGTMYYSAYEDDPWWYGYDDWAGYEAQTAAETTSQPDLVDEGKLREAQQAEQMAESLAMEAQRTWTEAQRATAALKKDRGFGAPSSSGSMASSGRCFLCNGPHLARDCPGRGGGYGGKGKFKGKSKHGYVTEMDAYYAKGKSKSKGKGKSKKGMYLDADAAWKGKGKNPEWGPRSVNAYAASAEYFVGGLELSSTMDMASATTSTARPERGMIDCGATASAAPEAVVKGLIASILEKDHGARVDIDSNSRPYFRFGDGRWGRALYRIHLTSKASGIPRKFSLYALPNPKEYFQAAFDKSSLVPILVGMDFLGKNGNGLIIDFTTGLATSSLDDNPEVFHLLQNQKGHFMLDVCEYLTRGHTVLEGHAHVVINDSDNLPSSSEVHVLELHVVTFDLSVSDMVYESTDLQQSRDRLLHMYCMSRQRQGLSIPADLCSMLATRSSLEAPTTSPTRSSSNGDSLALDGPGGGRDHGGSSQGQSGICQAPSTVPGHQSVHASRSTRPSDESKMLALLRKPHTGSSSSQCSRTMDPLCSVRPSNVVHAAEGIAIEHDGGHQCGDGHEDAETAQGTHRRSQADPEGVSPHDGEDHGREGVGEIDPGAHRGTPGDTDTEGSDYGNQRQCGRLRECDDQGQRRGADCGLRSGGRNCAIATTMRPLSQQMAKKLMLFVSLMTSAISNLLMGLHLDGCDGLWEISGAPHSWLSQSATLQGLQARPINYQTGYDLYKEDTWHRLRQLQQKARPRRLWLSLPCSKWCPWKAIDQGEASQRALLETARRKERRVLRQALRFVQDVLSEDPDVQVYWEWPTSSSGWSQHAMAELQDWLHQRELPWLSCRVDGCVYGLRDDQQGAFIKKRWTIKTTDEIFHRRYRAKVCPGHHPHVDLQGLEHSPAAYYPWRLVDSITRSWRDDATPTRHRQLLSLRHDLPALCENDDFGPLPDNGQDQLVEALDAPDIMDYNLASREILEEPGRLRYEHMAREARLRKRFAFHECESILSALHDALRVRGSTSSHTRGTVPGVTSLNMGVYSHGSFVGVFNFTRKSPELCRYINHFLQHHLPQQQWSSIMVTFNTRLLPHRDHHNLKGSRNILTCFGDFDKGGLWLSGTPPDDQPVCRRYVPGRGYFNGYVKETKGKFVVFDPAQVHASEAWKGYRISLSAYTTRLAPWLSTDDSRLITSLGFPARALREPKVPNGEMMEMNSSEFQRPEALTQEEVDVLNSSEFRRPEALIHGPFDFYDQLAVLPEGVSQEEYDAWVSKVAKFHRSAGHPTNRNLARIVSDGGHPKWKVQVALEHKCPACEANKPGSVSSGQVPPASTAPMYRAWQAVTVDAAEWPIPGTKKKMKFVLFMDFATKFRIVAPLKMYDIMAMDAESADSVIQAFSERWLSVFPKPQIAIMDSAKTFTSLKMHEFLSTVNILPHFIAEKEHWSHGVAEAAVQDMKSTATAIHMEALEQDPSVTLHLAAAALNSTEYTAGFSSYQWVFGQNYNITDEDYRTFASLPRSQQQDFTALVTARQQAEEIARRTRATRVLTKLANTTVRQPLRDFKEMDLVKIWRKQWPTEIHKGPRGGSKKSGRPHWIGPGRVIFHEILPQQQEGDPRRHIVWVLIGSQLYRCSVHSVRHVTETERFLFETSGEEDPSRWKTLADVLPRREYHDIVTEEPGEEETELPPLPDRPDPTTVQLPLRRVRQKTTFKTGDWSTDPVRDRLQVEDEAVNDYGEGPTTSDPATSSTTTAVREEPHLQVPEPKRAKLDLEATAATTTLQPTWVEELYMAEQSAEQEINIFTAFEETNEFLKIEFDIGPATSNRQQKMLLNNPQAFLVKKMKDSEVVIAKLPPHERQLFARAKTKEVSSFLSNEAVRRCLSKQEIKEAFDTNRIVKARWVLTWKLVPPEDHDDALRDARENPETLHDKAGRRKAKARIVLLGFQHPNLLDRNFKTAAPVQSLLGRNLLYQMSAQHQWPLEGLDLATAFLQTQPTEADAKLWTTGVQELRDALQVGEEGIMRILRNIYGSTTAPRGLWLDLHKTLTALGGEPVLAERCLWIWKSQDREDGHHMKVIGAMGGHVDDFHRIGDGSAEWLELKAKVDGAYKWGTAKKGNYRHAGTDVSTIVKPDGEFYIEVDQSYYAEGIPDLEISPERLRDNGPLRPQEIGACRTTLGALQWMGFQTQPQLCARCNLLLTEIVVQGSLAHAREIQEMLGEVRRGCTKLRFFRLPTATHWTELVFIFMGDQAHCNRPKGGSTGGLITMIAGPESLLGKVCPMTLIAWRTWKLQRKAVGSNDAEVQSILEAEDQNFRARLLWTELHGAHEKTDNRENLVTVSERQAAQIRGVLCTDSRGGYDAVEVNESPLLGLSNLRSALQAFQLRDNLQRVRCELRWLASDYDLADGLTKKKAEARTGLLKFLATWHWSIAFDKNFVSAKKSKQQGKTAIGEIDEFLKGDSPELMHVIAESLFMVVQHD